MTTSSRPAPLPRKKKRRISSRHGRTDYEAFKQSLQRRNLTPTEYQREIVCYCDKHKI